MAQIDNNLTHQIIGAVYQVYNSLGYGYQEKYYYRAILIALEKLGLLVEQQVLSQLSYEGKSIGRYFLDFLINKHAVLEIKVANQIYPKHIRQVLGYLKNGNYPVGIIAAFTEHGVIIKRIING